MEVPRQNGIIRRESTSLSPIALPQNVDDILRIDGLEIWLYDPERSLYKVYSDNDAILRALEKAPKKFGIKPGASYSKQGKVFARDFIVRFAEMQSVIEHVQGCVESERKLAKITPFSTGVDELGHPGKGGR